MTTPYLKFKEALQADNDYAWSWHANLACCIMDEGSTPKQANQAAARFMTLAFDIDVTQFDQWKSLPWAGLESHNTAFMVHDESNPSRRGICYSYRTHFDIVWDDGTKQNGILDISDIGVAKIRNSEELTEQEIESNTVKCIGGPVDGAIYRMRALNHDFPDGMWFNSVDEHERPVQNQYALGMAVNFHNTDSSGAIYNYCGQLIDTGLDFETE